MPDNEELQIILQELAQPARRRDMPRRVILCQKALTLVDRENQPELWGAVQNELANSLAQNPLGERAENIEQAILHYQQALEVYTRQAYPDKCRGTSRRLGNVGFENQKWSLAIDAYTSSLAAQDVLMRSTTVRASKTTEIKEVQNIPVRAAYAYVQLGELQSAMEVLENGRARLLAEALEQNRRDLERLPELGFKEIHDNYIKTIQDYDDLLTVASSENRPKDWQKQVEVAQEKLHKIEERIRDEVGGAHPEFAYFMDDIPFEVIRAQAAETPLVYVLATSHGGLALVVTKNKVRSIALENLTKEKLHERVIGEDGEDTYLRSYLGHSATWQKQLESITAWLWDAVMEPILPALTSQKEVILIPTGLLSLLPLHAAWTPDDDYPTGRRYAIDEIGFNYTPSVRALISARRQAPQRQFETIMAVDNPDGSLVFSEPEVKAALSHFENEKAYHLANGRATEEDVRQAMTEYDILHFSTHGKADFGHPLQSGLLMANEDELTLEEISKVKLEKARLAILSACETGLPSDLDMLDEVVSLPSGLLQAGVPGVIGSLWAVNDMSTAMLMTQFYEYWRVDRLSPPDALRQAQIWLRDSTTEDKKKRFKNFVDSQAARMGAETAKAFYSKIGWDDDQSRVFKSPVYWAAFTYVGV